LTTGGTSVITSDFEGSSNKTAGTNHSFHQINEIIFKSRPLQTGEIFAGYVTASFTTKEVKVGDT
jgi:hypothetical protein